MSWRVDEQAADAVACAPRHAGALVLAGCAAIELGAERSGGDETFGREATCEISKAPMEAPPKTEMPVSPRVRFGCSAPVKLECSAKSDPGLCTVVVAGLPEIHDKLTFSKPPSKTDPQVG